MSNIIIHLGSKAMKKVVEGSAGATFHCCRSHFASLEWNPSSLAGCAQQLEDLTPGELQEKQQTQALYLSAGWTLRGVQGQHPGDDANVVLADGTLHHLHLGVCCAGCWVCQHELLTQNWGTCRTQASTRDQQTTCGSESRHVTQLFASPSSLRTPCTQVVAHAFHVQVTLERPSS